VGVFVGVSNNVDGMYTGIINLEMFT